MKVVCESLVEQRGQPGEGGREQRKVERHGEEYGGFIVHTCLDMKMLPVIVNLTGEDLILTYRFRGFNHGR